MDLKKTKIKTLHWYNWTVRHKWVNKVKMLCSSPLLPALAHWPPLNLLSNFAFNLSPIVKLYTCKITAMSIQVMELRCSHSCSKIFVVCTLKDAESNCQQLSSRWRNKEFSKFQCVLESAMDDLCIMWKRSLFNRRPVKFYLFQI